MVAPVGVGVGKAATAVSEGIGKAGAKGAETATHSAGESFEKLLGDPSQGGAGQNPAGPSASQAAGTGATGSASVAAPASAGGPASTATAGSSAAPAANASPAAGPGDKILQGIDKARQEAGDLVNQVGQISGTGSGDGGKVGDMLSMQASLANFEITTQVGGKGMQETNQAVQTLLKGQ